MSAQLALPLPLIEGDRVRWLTPACDWGICKGVGRVVKAYNVPEDDALRVLVQWQRGTLPTFALGLERVTA